MAQRDGETVLSSARHTAAKQSVNYRSERAGTSSWAPQEFIKYFLDCGLKIEDFIMIMRAADHRLKPDGLHTGKGRGGDWNKEWRQFIREYPAQNTPEHQERVMNKFEEMVKKVWNR